MSEENKVLEIGNRKYYSQYYVNQLQQENKQLKSILTELEEWLKEEIRKYREKEQKWIKMHFMDFSEIAEKIRFEVTLDKIQELKEKYK